MHATTLPAESQDAADRAGGLARPFLVATLLFVGLVVTMTVGLSDRQAAQDEVAGDLGVGIDDIPPDRLADILRETWNTPAVVLIGLLALSSTLIYCRGMVILGGVAPELRPVLARLSAALPVIGVGGFLGLLGLERWLTEEPVWLLHNWWVSHALLSVFVLTVTGSLVLAVVRLWPTGLARRTSVVVLLLAVVLAALSVTAAAPPVLPLVLATVFAFNVGRALRGVPEATDAAASRTAPPPSEHHDS